MTSSRKIPNPLGHRAAELGCRIDVMFDEEMEAHAKATLVGIKAKKVARTATAKAAQPATPQPPKRLSLADLKAAALARKTGLNQHTN